MVKIRLRRMGATKRPFYRVVVADSRSPRDGRFIESIGKYHPMDDPSIIEIDEDRALYWLSQGAQPSSQVQNLLKVKGIWARFEADRGGAGSASVSSPARAEQVAPMQEPPGGEAAPVSEPLPAAEETTENSPASDAEGSA
jgi:small subunit ribosomal protein S16